MHLYTAKSFEVFLNYLYSGVCPNFVQAAQNLNIMYGINKEKLEKNQKKFENLVLDLLEISVKYNVGHIFNKV